jgi:YtkA-like
VWTLKLGISAIAAGMLCPVAGFAAPTCGADLRGAQRMESDHYVLAYRTLPATPVIGRHFAVEMAACPKGDALPPASVAVDAYMPEHGHGMNYKAAVKPTGNAHYRADGLMFHMPGRWDLIFYLQSGDKTERLTRSIALE